MTPVIEIRGLTKRFGEVRALDDVNLSVMPGEVFGFLGLNGAGKSTTIRAILGMIRIDSGEVRVFGTNVFRASPKPWNKVGHLVEAAVAYPELTSAKTWKRPESTMVSRALTRRLTRLNRSVLLKWRRVTRRLWRRRW